MQKHTKLALLWLAGLIAYSIVTQGCRKSEERIAAEALKAAATARQHEKDAMNYVRFLPNKDPLRARCLTDAQDYCWNVCSVVTKGTDSDPAGMLTVYCRRRDWCAQEDGDARCSLISPNSEN